MLRAVAAVRASGEERAGLPGPHRDVGPQTGDCRALTGVDRRRPYLQGGNECSWCSPRWAVPRPRRAAPGDRARMPTEHEGSTRLDAALVCVSRLVLRREPGRFLGFEEAVSG